jgi:hypothetical protein
MKNPKLLSISDDWLKYAIWLKLCNDPKENLVELRNAALSDSRIQSFLYDVARYHSLIL